MSNKTARAFAPASVANVAVGFDILGFSFAGCGDTVEVEWSPGESVHGVTVTEIRDGPFGSGAGKIPKDSLRNTAAVSVQAMLNKLALKGAVRLKIEKGIPLSSGMGGSAASAVASVVAINALLERHLDWIELLDFALEGEKVASGGMHLDNVLPCLRGGLNLVAAPGQYVKWKVPNELYCALVHPDIEIQTRFARSLLSENTTLKLHVEQSGYLGGFLAGLALPDWDMIKATLHDVIVEPQRSQLIPGFNQAKESALKAGALGFSISGSGPTVFALARGRAAAEKSSEAIRRALTAAGLSSHSWVAPVEAEGARIL